MTQNMKTYTAYTPYGNVIAISSDLNDLKLIAENEAYEMGADCYILEGEADEEGETVYETWLSFWEA